MRGLRRSKLFVPGNRPDLMVKAERGAADALSFDLEDAVPEAEKAAARQATAEFLGRACGSDKTMVVRVNALDTGLMIEDILAVTGPGLDIVNVPKCDAPRDLHVADEVLRHAERARGLESGSIKLMPTLETPAGIRRAHEIATASPRTVALQLGLGDLKATTGIVAETARLNAVRTLVVLAAAEAGIAAFDSAHPDIADIAGFEADAKEARALGFRGKSCIHPSQVEPCNRIFAPGEAEIEEARALLAAYEDAKANGIGAIKFRGRLVDSAHAVDARELLETVG